MTDIRDPRLLWAKFALFVVLGLLGAAIALVLFPSWRLAVLMVVTDGEPDMLFHLGEDPYEMNNLLDDEILPAEAEATVGMLMEKIRAEYSV